MSLALSFDLGQPRHSTFSNHGSEFVKSASSSTFSLCEILGRIDDSSIVWHFDSYRTFQRIRELLRFFCGQLVLGCQAALVLNDKLVDTVGDMVVDLARPILHVVERFLVRNITDSGDVVCTCLG